MNDRELLEWAAKAAGITHDGVGFVSDTGLPMNWNPLYSDGDALRLAVQLSITASPGCITSRFVVACGDCGEVLEERRPDQYAATRRAIVRAAAEIGKAMEG